MFINNQIRKIEKEANDFFEKMFANNGNLFIYKNINLLNKISEDLIKIIEKVNIDTFSKEKALNESSHLNLEENIKLVEYFYHTLGINIDINKMIKEEEMEIYNKDATITGDVSSIDLTSCFVFGTDKKSLHLLNSGNFYDSIIMVHELAHYFDNYGYDGLSDMITEVKAIAMEMLYGSTMKELYLRDVNNWNMIRLNGMIFSINRAHEWSAFIKLYKMTGHISKSNFEKLYGTSLNYEKFINHFWALSELNLRDSFSYLLSAYFSPYINLKYQNNSNKESLKNLFENTNKMTKIYDFLEMDFNEETHKLFVNAFQSFIDETLGYSNEITKK